MGDNVARGRVPIELDKPRVLWYSLTAMKTLKTEHKITMANFATVLLDADEDPDYDKIALLLAFGLHHEDPDVTPEWVLDHVGAAELTEAAKAIARAMGGELVVGLAAPPKALKK